MTHLERSIVDRGVPTNGCCAPALTCPRTRGADVAWVARAGRTFVQTMARRGKSSIGVVVAMACLMSTGVVGAQESPSEERLSAIIERVTPILQEELRQQELTLGAPVFLRIFKASRTLEVWMERDGRFRLFKQYEICSYAGDLGPKLRTGDLQSPEGFYFVTPGRLNPASRFHLSFDLGYPNAYDRAHGRTGSDLMVHGDCVSIGCYAMTDASIEEIYALVDAAFRGGQPFVRVHIFPFHMDAANLEAQASSPWADFWKNLKEGYDWFERCGRPPNVEVEEKRYVFNACLEPQPRGERNRGDSSRGPRIGVGNIHRR